MIVCFTKVQVSSKVLRVYAISPSDEAKPLRGRKTSHEQQMAPTTGQRIAMRGEFLEPMPSSRISTKSLIPFYV
jgi:hypothetical protein